MRGLRKQTTADANAPSGARGKASVFEQPPAYKEMRGRPLLLGRPRIIGADSQLDALHRHTRQLAQEFFPPSAFSALFPTCLAPSRASRLSFLSASSLAFVGSRIPVPRRRRRCPPALGCSATLSRTTPSAPGGSRTSAFSTLARSGDRRGGRRPRRAGLSRGLSGTRRRARGRGARLVRGSHQDVRAAAPS